MQLIQPPIVPPVVGVVVQYSADNISFHTPPQAGDRYIRFSTDGGSTWDGGMDVMGQDADPLSQQWSLDGSTNWGAYSEGMMYTRFSVNGGSTWTPAIQVIPDIVETQPFAGTSAGKWYAITGSGAVLFDAESHAGLMVGYCLNAGYLITRGLIEIGTDYAEGVAKGVPAFADALNPGDMTFIAPGNNAIVVLGWKWDADNFYVAPYTAWGNDDGSSV